MSKEKLHHEIDYTRTGSIVTITIDTDLAHAESDIGCVFNFSCDFGTAARADLFVRYVTERHTEAIIGIRRAEFRSGWRHAKAKKHGLSWFNEYFDSWMKPKPTHE